MTLWNERAATVKADLTAVLKLVADSSSSAGLDREV